MKRRGFVKALAVAPAVPAALAQQTVNRTPPAAAEAPRLELSIADDVAAMQPRFFTAPQYAVLCKVCDLLMPRMGDTPGAIDACAPEFLDFLISESPKERQAIYSEGLDALNSAAEKRFGKEFAGVDTSEAAALLAPLRQQWTYDPPADVLARFLWTAKQDVRTATVNSHEYVTAASSQGGRRAAGIGLYWYPLD
jgi:hypothetical protein